MKTSLRILYVGPLCEGGTCLQRMRALRDLGHDVLGVDTQPDHVRLVEARLLNRIRGKLFRLGWDAFGPQDFAGVNPLILDHISSFRDWNILWIDKGLTVEAKTLHEVKALSPKCIIVGYSPDDMYGRHNQSRQFLEHIHLYDVFFTTKSYGVNELRSLGCKRAEFIENGFDPHTHRPILLTAYEKEYWGGDVAFVGAFERDRYEMISRLVRMGFQVLIRGPGWQPYRGRHPNLLIKQEWALGDDYAKAICATKVNLCFLRKANRDLQTQRSFEIPACGGFMLAERSEEHLELFQEGKEAVFFSSPEELTNKVKYYLTNDYEREAIAKAGRERCLASLYSNHDRLSKAISVVIERMGNE